MSKMHKFNGVILAGGHSSRMGADKALLTLDGETLLARAQQLLSECGAGKVRVCRNDDNPAHIQDQFKDSGPLGGIHAALTEDSSRPTLVIPVDLPLMQCSELSRLIDAGYTHQCTSHFNDLYIPIFIWNPESLIDGLTQRLVEGNRLSLKRFFSEREECSIACSEEHHLLNANTPEEWQAILERFKSL
jgi:molybdopterin-guanine dinucleotide biosynthesis protein A